MSTPLGLKAIALASQSIGVMEDPIGSNAGQWVDEYLASVGLAPGNPWCAAFVYFKLQQAAHELGMDSLNWPKTGSTTLIGQWAAANGKSIDSPNVGSVFLVPKPGAPGQFHHTGFVLQTFPDGTFLSIEGNSNNDGSAEGIGVFSNRRQPGDLRFVVVE